MDIALTQAEADALIRMPKIRADDQERTFPPVTQSLVVPLLSQDRHENFILDIQSGRINLAKIKYQNRARQNIVLVRLDVAGAPHRNPDDEIILCPHLHLYREGFGDKWAKPVPPESFTQPDDKWTTLREFLTFCNVVDPPHFSPGLFS